MTDAGDFDDLLPPLEDLREVIPVVREYERRAGGRWIIASVEVWAHMFVVRYAMTGPAEQPGVSRVPWMRDDVGTKYQLRSGSGGGTPHELQLSDLMFAPALSPNARRLTFAINGVEEIEFPLLRPSGPHT